MLEALKDKDLADLHDFLKQALNQEKLSEVSVPKAMDAGLIVPHVEGDKIKTPAGVDCFVARGDPNKGGMDLLVRHWAIALDASRSLKGKARASNFMTVSA